MTKTPIIPPDRVDWYERWHYAPAIVSGDVIYVSGCTGMHPDGTIADDPAEQFRQSFRNIASILEHAGAGFGDVVDMTSYHVGFNHIELFARIKDEFIAEPYPAWTAIGVATLVVPEALVETRATARLPTPPP